MKVNSNATSHTECSQWYSLPARSKANKVNSWKQTALNHTTSTMCINKQSLFVPDCDGVLCSMVDFVTVGKWNRNRCLDVRDEREGQRASHCTTFLSVAFVWYTRAQRRHFEQACLIVWNSSRSFWNVPFNFSWTFKFSQCVCVCVRESWPIYCR